MLNIPMVRERIPTQSVEASTPSIVERTSHSSSRLKSLHYHEAPPLEPVHRDGSSLSIGLELPFSPFVFSVLKQPVEPVKNTRILDETSLTLIPVHLLLEPLFVISRSFGPPSPYLKDRGMRRPSLNNLLFVQRLLS